MRLTKNRKILALSVLSAGFVAAICALSFTQNAKTVYAAELPTEIAKTSYLVGENFVVPTSATLTMEDESTVSSNVGTLKFPDGTVYESGEYVLGQAGTYELTYYAEVNGKKVTATKEFSALNENWSVSTERSLAEYGALSLCNNKSIANGIKVSLASGDVFSYSVPINLWNITNEDGNVDVCQIFPDIKAKLADLPAVSIYTLKLIDCYDANNYIEFYVWSKAGSGTYLGAGAATQNLGGLEAYAATNDRRDVMYEGMNYRFHNYSRYNVTSQYGTSSKGGSDTKAYSEIGGTSFYYNPETQVIKRFKRDATGKVSDAQIVNDLDSEVLHGTNVFKGFTTGEVYVAIEGQNYNATSFDFEVASVLGVTGDSLQQKSVVDNDAPAVTIDAKSSYNAVLREPIEIPKDISIYDYNYYGDLRTSVYYAYGTENQSAVFLKNGVFTPMQEGTYTVIYKAVDSFGNIRETKIEYFAKEGKAISYEEPTKFTQLVAGKIYELPFATNVSSANENTVQEIIVTNPLGVEKKYTLQDDSFMPDTIGTYTITYVFYDAIYHEEFSYEVACADTENTVLFYDEIKLPKYFIKGATYSLDAYSVYVPTANGLSEVKAEMFVSVDSAEYKAISDITNFKVEAQQSLKFKFVYNGKTLESETYSVIDLGYGTQEKEYEKYFYGEYVSVDSSFSGFTYQFNAENETNKSLEFINLVSFSNFELSFTIPKGFENFAELKIVLTDYANADNQNVISYKNTVEGATFSVNGGKEQKLANGFADFMQRVEVSSIEGLIKNNQSAAVECVEFQSDLCFLSIELVSISGDSQICISKLNNQSFGTFVYEDSPEFAYTEVQGVKEVGDVVTVSAATVSGVLNPVLQKDCLVSVYAPDGTFVTSKDGIVLNNVSALRTYEITLEKCGSYKVEYSGLLNTGMTGYDATRAKTSSYPINVLDKESPKISLEDTKTVSLKVGETHVVRSYSVTDNNTQESLINVIVLVYNENGNLVAWNVKDIAFDKAGTYKVVVCAEDEAGNMATASYAIIVK